VAKKEDKEPRSLLRVRVAAGWWNLERLIDSIRRVGGQPNCFDDCRADRSATLRDRALGAIRTHHVEDRSSSFAKARESARDVAERSATWPAMDEFRDPAQA
jgi:hypothetical protein